MMESGAIIYVLTLVFSGAIMWVGGQDYERAKRKS